MPLLENVIKLLNRGGISSMMNIVNTIICGYAFAGIVEKIGCLQVILDSVSHKIYCLLEINRRYLLASAMLVFTAGVASISIIMVGFL